MNASTNYHVIGQTGRSAFVMVSYDEFMEKCAKPVEQGLIPHDIVVRLS